MVFQKKFFNLEIFSLLFVKSKHKFIYKTKSGYFKLPESVSKKNLDIILRRNMKLILEKYPFDYSKNNRNKP